MKFKLVEDYLNEAKDWYEISGGANNYYIYGTSVTDAEHTANRILGRIPKEGTFKQWKSLPIGTSAFKYVPAKTVNCSDGVTNLRH